MLGSRNVRALPLAGLLVVLVCGACQIGETLFRAPERSGPMVSGEQWGRWVYRYPGGAKKAEGEYKRDKQVGNWTYWFENGSVEWQGTFDDQRLSGPSSFGSGARPALPG